MQEGNELLNWSYTLTMVGAALIVAGGLAAGTVMYAWSWGGSPMMGMMGYYGFADWPNWMPLWIAGWSVITGGVVAFAAGRIHVGTSPAGWGLLAVIGGALSLFAMGGFMLGALAAIIGGSLAIAGSGRTSST